MSLSMLAGAPSLASKKAGRAAGFDDFDLEGLLGESTPNPPAPAMVSTTRGRGVGFSRTPTGGEGGNTHATAPVSKRVSFESRTSDSSLPPPLPQRVGGHASTSDAASYAVRSKAEQDAEFAALFADAEVGTASRATPTLPTPTPTVASSAATTAVSRASALDDVLGLTEAVMHGGVRAGGKATPKATTTAPPTPAAGTTKQPMLSNPPALIAPMHAAQGAVPSPPPSASVPLPDHPTLTMSTSASGDFEQGEDGDGDQGTTSEGLLSDSAFAAAFAVGFGVGDDDEGGGSVSSQPRAGNRTHAASSSVDAVKAGGKSAGYVPSVASGPPSHGGVVGTTRGQQGVSFSLLASSAPSGNDAGTPGFPVHVAPSTGVTSMDAAVAPVARRSTGATPRGVAPTTTVPGRERRHGSVAAAAAAEATAATGPDPAVGGGEGGGWPDAAGTPTTPPTSQPKRRDRERRLHGGDRSMSSGRMPAVGKAALAAQAALLGFDSPVLGDSTMGDSSLMDSTWSVTSPAANPAPMSSPGVAVAATHTTRPASPPSAVDGAPPSTSTSTPPAPTAVSQHIATAPMLPPTTPVPPVADGGRGLSEQVTALTRALAAGRAEWEAEREALNERWQARYNAAVAGHDTDLTATKLKWEAKVADAVAAGEEAAERAQRAHAARVAALEAEITQLKRGTERAVADAVARCRADEALACEARVTTAVCAGRVGWEKEAAARDALWQAQVDMAKRAHADDAAAWKARWEELGTLSLLAARLKSVTSQVEEVSSKVSGDAAAAAVVRSSALDARERVLADMETHVSSVLTRVQDEVRRLGAVTTTLDDMLGCGRRDLDDDRGRLKAESARLTAWQGMVQAQFDALREAAQSERQALAEARAAIEAERHAAMAELTGLLRQAGTARREADAAARDTAAACEQRRLDAMAEADSIRREVAALAAELPNLRLQRDDLTAQVDELKRSLATWTARQAEVAGRAAEVEAEGRRVADLVRSVSEREAAVEARRADIQRQHEEAMAAVAEARAKADEAAGARARAESAVREAAEERRAVAEARAALSRERAEALKLRRTMDGPAPSPPAPSSTSAASGGMAGLGVWEPGPAGVGIPHPTPSPGDWSRHATNPASHAAPPPSTPSYSLGGATGGAMPSSLEPQAMRDLLRAWHADSSQAVDRLLAVQHALVRPLMHAPNGGDGSGGVGSHAPAAITSSFTSHTTAGAGPSPVSHHRNGALPPRPPPSTHTPASGRSWNGNAVFMDAGSDGSMGMRPKALDTSLPMSVEGGMSLNSTRSHGRVSPSSDGTGAHTGGNGMNTMSLATLAQLTGAPGAMPTPASTVGTGVGHGDGADAESRY